MMNMAHNHGHWSQGLLSSMKDPSYVIDSDDQVVVIKDKYPKALYHFLVLPKAKIPTLHALTSEHLDLLKHMHAKGEETADRACKELRFRFGYHAVASMSQIHMHVISQDFVSPCLKTKKHWNSFNTAYFVESTDLIKRIAKHGKWTVDVQNFQDALKHPLKCHVCDKKIESIPALKKHIALHSVARNDS